jgi:FkbM family methyltransferase
MRDRVDAALARVPRLYAWLLSRRRRVNLEKLCFLALVRRGDVVFEAGANQGYYTALFSRLVGRRGSVHAFEPVPATCRALAATLERRGRRDNVVLNESALAETAGALTIYQPATDPAHASLARHRDGAWAVEQEIHTLLCAVETIDGYLLARGRGRDDRGWAPPDFLKSDAEGAELRILEGAAATLRRRPPLLHLEVNPNWSRDMGWEPADLPRFLAPFGYRDFVLVDDLAVRPLRAAAAELTRFGGVANLICAVPGLHDSRMARLRSMLGRWYRAGGRENRARPSEGRERNDGGEAGSGGEPA